LYEAFLGSFPLPLVSFLSFSSFISFKLICFGFSPATHSTSAFPKRIRSLFFARLYIGGVEAREASLGDYVPGVLVLLDEAPPDLERPIVCSNF